jgi:hypothetical protein
MPFQVKGLPFSKWQCSARQGLLISPSKFVGIEIFHSLVDTARKRTTLMFLCEQSRRKLRARKVSPTGVESRVRFLSYSCWFWERRVIANFTFTVLLRTILGNIIYETGLGCDMELLKSYCTPHVIPLNVFPTIPIVSPQVYAHSLCCEQLYSVISN